MPGDNFRERNRYLRFMNEYRTPRSDTEIRDYVRSRLSERQRSRAQQCDELMKRLRSDRQIYFSLTTALELAGVELPYCPSLSQKDFHITVLDASARTRMKGVHEHVWRQPFCYNTMANAVRYMTPVDTWVQFGQYLGVIELIVLAESIIRAGLATKEQLSNRLDSFHRIIGRKRCDAAIRLISSSDSVQETRTRLALLSFGLPCPVPQHTIVDPQTGERFVVDMAYPEQRVAIEYDGDHHRTFRTQYVRDQKKRSRLHNLGWKVVVVFAGDLCRADKQRVLAQEVANCLGFPLPGRPLHSYRALVDPRLAVNARRGEHARAMRRRAALGAA